MVGTLPLMGLNLGTGTSEQAADLVEYCNIDKGSRSGPICVASTDMSNPTT